MTRGRHRNTLHVVAADLDDAREQFTAALQRDRADRGLTDATRAARVAVDGLVADGPVAFVNTERARLREHIEVADREAARWEQALGALTRQSAEHHAENELQAQVVAAADTHLLDVRAQVAGPLIEQATADGTGYLTVQERMWQANRALPTTRRFGKRAAARTAREATQAHGTMQEAVRRRWGDVPPTTTHLSYWAQAVVDRRADADPRVIAAQHDAEHAHLEQQQLTADHAAARSALRQSIGGGYLPTGLQARAAQLRAHAQHARHHLAQIEALPSAEAAQLIRDRAAQAEAEQIAAATRLAPSLDPGRWRSSGPAYPPHLERDVGPSR
jgi:hypothetical protein